MDVAPRHPPACVVCGAAAPARLSGTFCDEAWRCARCRHTFVGTVPPTPELDAIYDVYKYDEEEEPFPAFLHQILGALIDSFAPYRQTGRLLDVGFGAGLLLREAGARGWKPHGVEVSRVAVEKGRAAGIGELQLGDFVSVPLEPGSFDVIVMTELIEHLPDPMPFLRRAAELLRPGGLLYLTTPHGRGLSGRVLGADWSVLRPPEHLHLFSVESMRRCLTDAGFARPRVYTQGLLPHELVVKLRAALPWSAEQAPEPKPVDGCVRVARSYRLNAMLMKSPFGRTLKSATNLAIRASGLGDSLRVEAIR